MEIDRFQVKGRMMDGQKKRVPDRKKFGYDVWYITRLGDGGIKPQQVRMLGMCVEDIVTQLKENDPDIICVTEVHMAERPSDSMPFIIKPDEAINKPEAV